MQSDVDLLIAVKLTDPCAAQAPLTKQSVPHPRE